MESLPGDVIDTGSEVGGSVQLAVVEGSVVRVHHSVYTLAVRVGWMPVLETKTRAFRNVLQCCEPTTTFPVVLISSLEQSRETHEVELVADSSVRGQLGTEAQCWEELVAVVVLDNLADGSKRRLVVVLSELTVVVQRVGLARISIGSREIDSNSAVDLAPVAKRKYFFFCCRKFAH